MIINSITIFRFYLFLAFGLLFVKCGEKVYRAYIPNESVKWFDSFLIEQPGIDIWLSTRLISEKFDSIQSQNGTIYKYMNEFRIKDPELLNAVRLKHNIKFEVLIDDLNEYLRAKSFLKKRSLSNTNKNVVGKYASYNEITSWMIDLSMKYPDLVQVTRVGKTFEKRPILALKLTNNPRSKELKPLFLFDGGIHAREWLSIATIVYMIDRLIKQQQKKDPVITKLLKRFELHFIPVINPDGYEYSRASKYNRYWRKNMRYTRFNSAENSCYGVDLNRNFDHKWMVSGSSANPCSEVFAGRYPASEPEIKSLMNYIIKKSPRWISHISLHSYGAIWLSPFSYSKFHIPENFEETCQKAMIAIKKIEKIHDLKFRFGSASHELYEASGCSEDWSKDVAKINHTYVVELKPEKSETPESGFEHPENKIEEAGLEMYDGFIEYINSFTKNEVEKSIIQECKKKLEEMYENLEYYTNNKET